MKKSDPFSRCPLSHYRSLSPTASTYACFGSPILGDRLYAHEEALSMASRLQLHAESLSFLHPTWALAALMSPTF